MLSRLPFKKAACFVFIVFSLNALDIPAPVLHTQFNPKTCCGRPVCQCTHAKAALCPFKNKARAEKNHADRLHATAHPPQTGKHCHLKKANAAVQKKVNEASEEFSVFKKAPCHSERSPSTSPSHAKEFVLGPLSKSSPHAHGDSFYDREIHRELTPFVSGIEHPPRLF